MIYRISYRMPTQKGTYHALEALGSSTNPEVRHSLCLARGFGRDGARMTAESGKIALRTSAKDEIVDITSRVQEVVSKSGIKQGLACVFVVGSTAAVTTVEHEPGLVHDMQDAMQRLYPKDIDYEHHKRWGDGNGHSHIRASFIGPSLTVPVIDGKLLLGTWQQIVFLELDVRPRSRELAVEVVGDP
jgi:secondary thiamine-phosphate synthase enzyme